LSDDKRGPFDRTANLLGALALAITDRTSAAVGESLGQSESAAVALSALYHFLDEPSVDLLRQVLGLTPSGTVRLIDRLEAAGYVTRHPGADARSVVLRLTASGRRAAERVTTARAEVLEDALSGLAPKEREILDRLISRVLTGMIRPPGAVRWTCRLCDTTACGRETGDCPVANTARELYAEDHAHGRLVVKKDSQA
jgi:DNA-binding MarR family transcriptional regulator